MTAEHFALITLQREFFLPRLVRAAGGGLRTRSGASSSAVEFRGERLGRGRLNQKSGCVVDDDFRNAAGDESDDGHARGEGFENDARCAGLA